MSVIEKSYVVLLKGLLRAVNPIKKRITRTECMVHKFINNQSVIILKNDGCNEACELMSSYIDYINAGVVWADQDLKSSNHFYNPDSKKGLYGNSNAKSECMAYYKRAINEYIRGDTKKAMFYFGAACHLIQDLTVPQHANVRLLDSHRRYEKWVMRVHDRHAEFKADCGGIYLNSVGLYVYLNSRKAIQSYKKYKHIKDREKRFHKITSIILVRAQKTTAGMMAKFHNDIKNIRPNGRAKPSKLFEHKVRMLLKEV